MLARQLQVFNYKIKALKKLNFDEIHRILSKICGADGQIDFFRCLIT